MPDPSERQPTAPGDRPRLPRQAERFHATEVAFHAPALEARLLNLSTVGAAIETSDPPRIGAALQCELENGQTSALVPGEVRWCKLGKTALDETGDVVPVYRAGIEFSDGTPHNLLRILRAAGLQRTAGTA